MAEYNFSSARFQASRAMRGKVSQMLQMDMHSCGSIAALAVIWYFFPKVRAEDVLRVAKPSPSHGCSQRDMVRVLSKFQVASFYKEPISLPQLRSIYKKGQVVLVTVQPEGWECDHWMVIRKIEGDKVLLSNPAPNGCEYEGLNQDGSMIWKDFTKVWSPCGGGLVCQKN